MEERVEAIETVAMETSDIVGRPLKEVKFPHGAIVGAVARDSEILAPNGESVINAGDRIVIFALRNTIPKVEKILMVKPEFF
jgi:trk system potassium uptake protein TrkA